jgi:hypothetical protein
MPSAAAFFGPWIFGAIGLAALVYGKKMVLPKKMILGAVLMVYPYFVAQTWLVWLIGAGLTAGLMYWRD